MAERQSAHRQDLERVALQTEAEQMRREFAEARWGQACAVIVALALIGGGVYLAQIGHPWEGTAMGGGGVIGGVGLQALVSSFLRGRTEDAGKQDKPKTQSKNQKNKK
jgi:uncharacterized membrane protein